MTFACDPAEQGSVMRRLYRDWRPTRLARVLNRVASSGRRHFPVAPGAPLSEFEAIADRYPVSG
jgi:hypothetical protein